MITNVITEIEMKSQHKCVNKHSTHVSQRIRTHVQQTNNHGYFFCLCCGMVFKKEIVWSAILALLIYAVLNRLFLEGLVNKLPQVMSYEDSMETLER